MSLQFPNPRASLELPVFCKNFIRSYEIACIDIVPFFALAINIDL